MKATLTTPLPIECFDLFAEMAWLKHRPELGCLCQGALDTGEGRLTPTLIASLLPGIGDVGAKNILNWCEMLRLCDEGGALRQLGKEVALTFDAPVPEQGVYRFWVTTHPLLGPAILKAERRTSRQDYHLDDLHPLPIDPSRDVVFTSATHPDERFILRDIPRHNGAPRAARMHTPSHCQLSWKLDFEGERNQWQLEGELGNPKDPLAPIHPKPKETQLDLWSVIAHWGNAALSTHGSWDASARRLLVSFEDLDDRALESFELHIDLNDMTVPGKGTYQKVRLEKVPLGPRSAKDADLWARNLLDRQLKKDRRYRTRGMLYALFANLIKDTPLESSNPTLPAHSTFVAQGAKALSPAVYWSLVAPVDLALTPPSTQALGPLSTTAASQATRDCTANDMDPQA